MMWNLRAKRTEKNISAKVMTNEEDTALARDRLCRGRSDGIGAEKLFLTSRSFLLTYLFAHLKHLLL